MITAELTHANVVFTDRLRGENTGPYESNNMGLFTGEDRATVLRNIEAQRVAFELDELRLLHQVHGADLHEGGLPADAELPDADGLVTAHRGVGLLVTGADCPPVAIASENKLAMLHCGWRSLAAGIIERAIGALGEGRLEAAVGPGISQQNYEVGEEVVRALGEDAVAAFASGHLSLQTVIKTKLRRGGVERVFVAEDCTFADPERFYSYRRDGDPTGRQAGIAWRS
ncbi:MAG: polyphenol oxidase family protein [Solirubrobacterales bacterium]